MNTSSSSRKSKYYNTINPGDLVIDYSYRVNEHFSDVTKLCLVITRNQYTAFVLHIGGITEVSLGLLEKV